VSDSDVEKVIYGQIEAMHKASLSLNQSCKVLARERRLTEESQYYEEQSWCLKDPGIADWR